MLASSDRAQAIVDAEAPWPALGSAPERCAEVWSNFRAIVVPARERNHAGFEEAARRSADDGWPIATRRSGGLAVPHGPDVACLTLSWYAPAPPAPAAAFNELAAIVCEAARIFGVEPEIGEVRDAVCPGDWDVAIGGRKFAGLAQRRSALRPDGCVGVVAHAALFCGIDIPAAVGAINNYYENLGLDQRFAADALANLGGHELVGATMSALAEAARRSGFASVCRGATGKNAKAFAPSS